MAIRHSNPLVEALDKAVEKYFKQRTLTPYKIPQVTEREIIEYQGRMRISGMEKFNAPCAVGAVNFFKNQQDHNKNKPTGALVLYVNHSEMADLFRAFSLKGFNSDSDPVVFENCIHFLGELSDFFLEELSKLGLPALLVDNPQAGQNTLEQGVGYKYKRILGIGVPIEDTYYELSYQLWNNKTFVLDLSLAPLKYKQ